MIAASVVGARLRDQVAGLAAVQGVADLAAALKSAPQIHGRPLAYVAHLGMQGGPARAVAGAYVQDLDTRIGVYVFFPSVSDPTGGRGQDEVGQVLAAILAALCGWVPEPNCPGPLRLWRQQMADLRPGLIAYEIIFAVQDQLRITT